MIFRKMMKSDINTCIPMVKSAYEKERLAVDSLPEPREDDYFYRLIDSIVDHDLAYVALGHNDQVVGFIGAYGPINEFFGTSNGVFVPTHGHGAISDKREFIYQSLLTYAMGEWAKQELLSYTATVFFHDEWLKNLLVMNGFGGRCLDLMTNVENVAKDVNELPQGYELCYLPYEMLDEVLPMKNKLVTHMAISPVFFPTPSFDLEKLVKKSEKRKSNFYGIRYHDELVGYVEMMKEGEHFASYHDSVVNITGAYLEESHRGNGLYEKLINYGTMLEAKRGFTRVGVDCETLNTTARLFWMKQFTPYTISLARRLDEHILEK